MNPNLQHYHVPVNADVHEIETMFVEEDDKVVNRLGVKGMGEFGMVGIPPRSRTPSFTLPANACAICRLRRISCCSESKETDVRDVTAVSRVDLLLDL